MNRFSPAIPPADMPVRCLQCNRPMSDDCENFCSDECQQEAHAESCDDDSCAECRRQLEKRNAKAYADAQAAYYAPGGFFDTIFGFSEESEHPFSCQCEPCDERNGQIVQTPR